jgi:hypothetical protein
VSSLGGSVVKSPSGIVTFLEGVSHNLVSSSPHDTGGLRVTWSAPSWVRWSLPNAAPFGVGPLRDVSRYTHLSFRVAQIYKNVNNTVGQDQDFNVQLSTSLGLSNKVRVSGHGRIPYPDEFLCSSLNCGPNPPNDFSKSAMSTIRVPLSAFTSVDLTDVGFVFLSFDLPERPKGAILLDSLELVQ